MEEVQKKRDAAALEAMKNVQAKDGKTAEVAKWFKRLIAYKY